MEQEKKLTIDRWHEMALAGRALPMPIPINGISMFPLVRRNCDRVTIVPLTERPVVGDIVLFKDPRAPRYILHRVIGIKDDVFTTRGDNTYAPDPPLTMAEIWGKAVLIERGRWTIKPKPNGGMRHAKCWYRVAKVLRLAGRIKHAAARIIGRKRK